MDKKKEKKFPSVVLKNNKKYEWLLFACESNLFFKPLQCKDCLKKNIELNVSRKIMSNATQLSIKRKLMFRSIPLEVSLEI